MKLTKNNLTIKSFVVTSFIASVMFAAKPAQAASLTYNWSFSGLANTGGTFVADDTTGVLSWLDGSIGGVITINGYCLLGSPLSVGNGQKNDNRVPLVTGGGGIVFGGYGYPNGSIVYNLFNFYNATPGITTLLVTTEGGTILQSSSNGGVLLFSCQCRT